MKQEELITIATETDKATDILETPITDESKAEKKKEEQTKKEKLNYIATSKLADFNRKVNNNLNVVNEFYNDSSITQERKAEIRKNSGLLFETKENTLRILTDKTNNRIDTDLMIQVDSNFLKLVGNPKTYRQVVDFIDILKNQVLNNTYNEEQKITEIRITPTTIRNEFKLVKNLKSAKNIITLSKTYLDSVVVITPEEKDKKGNIRVKAQYQRPFEFGVIATKKENGKYEKNCYTYTINPLYPWKKEHQQYIDIPKIFNSYFGIKRDIVSIAFRNLRIQYNKGFKETGKVEIPILEIAIKSGLLSDKTTNHQGTLIKKIMKAIEEIQTDKDNIYIELDSSKIKTSKKKDFLDSILYMSLKPGYTNNWIQKNQKQLEITSEEETKGEKDSKK